MHEPSTELLIFVLGSKPRGKAQGLERHRVYVCSTHSPGIPWPMYMLSGPLRDMAGGDSQGALDCLTQRGQRGPSTLARAVPGRSAPELCPPTKQKAQRRLRRRIKVAD